jgi:predicted ATPase
MLKRLHLKNFTVFADADFEFGPGLNVLVGTNGTGKSHVLKVGYIAARVTAKVLSISPNQNGLVWSEYLAQRLEDVFQAERLRELVRWDGSERADVAIEFEDDTAQKLTFSFSSSDSYKYTRGAALIKLSEYPNKAGLSRAIFIPPKEVLTLSWLRALYEKRVLPIDDTYPSLLDLLQEIPLRKMPTENVSALNSLVELLGGKVQTEGERFYLESDSRRVEMNMVAEGIRKFAMLERLLRNGVLIPENPLFWDEPESNLNPALLRQLAAILAELASQGFQIILATHSTDLLKEFHILSRQKDAKLLPIKYFGLNARPGEATTVVATDNFEYLPDVVALEVELEQADNLDEIFAREDRERHAKL